MDTGLDLWRIPQGWLVPRQCREELAGSVQGGQKATRPDSDVPVPKLWICRIVCKVSEDAFPHRAVVRGNPEIADKSAGGRVFKLQATTAARARTLRRAGTAT